MGSYQKWSRAKTPPAQHVLFPFTLTWPHPPHNFDNFVMQARCRKLLLQAGSCVPFLRLLPGVASNGRCTCPALATYIDLHFASRKSNSEISPLAGPGLRASTTERSTRQLSEGIRSLSCTLRIQNPKAQTTASTSGPGSLIHSCARASSALIRLAGSTTNSFRTLTNFQQHSMSRSAGMCRASQGHHRSIP